MSNTEKNMLFIKQVSDDVERIITKVGDYPMYKSSGQNSSFPDTFFPFSGLMEQQQGIYIQGYFVKPDFAKENDTENFVNTYSPPYYPEGFYEQMEKLGVSYEMMIRFGNIEAMVISKHIGGGFWQTDIGLSVSQYLEENYEVYISTIGIKNQDEISRLQDTSDVNFDVVKDSDAASVNKALGVTNYITHPYLPYPIPTLIDFKIENMPVAHQQIDTHKDNQTANHDIQEEHRQTLRCILSDYQRERGRPFWSRNLISRYAIVDGLRFFKTSIKGYTMEQKIDASMVLLNALNEPTQLSNRHKIVLKDGKLGQRLNQFAMSHGFDSIDILIERVACIDFDAPRVTR
jgi:hypothetical protein